VLSILDDGLGVLPELSRKDALTAIATNIGHSRKRQMTFDERMRQAMLGQYGIGLLGFWAVGHELRILSSVDGSEIWALTLFEDSPRYSIARAPEIIGRSGTWTEVQVGRLHRGALNPTIGLRLASYLSVELRGQLIRHGTELHVIDQLARVPANRLVVVKPSQLAGERLPDLEPVHLPGFKWPIDLALHFAGDAGPDAGRVRLACAGAVVLDDVSELPELKHAPWTDDRLVGVIDFPHLDVPPGSRRGIVPNEAATSLVNALVELEARVSSRLEERSRAESTSLSDELHRQLARMFTKATSFVPHLAWFPVARRAMAPGDGGPEGTKVADSGASRDAAAPVPRDEAQPELFPPGPLDAVAVRPGKLTLGVGDSKELRAVATDAQGRRLHDGVSFSWTATGGLTLLAAGEFVTVTAPVASENEQLELAARQGTVERRASVPVRVLADLQRKTDSGIPQPEEVNEPLQSWRSRLVDDRWQINVGHSDYRALAIETRPRLRYVATLLAKEVVSRNFPQPGVGATLEELVGLLAALERSGAWGGRSRGETD
jgi:hypothetical protein